jgi:tRNA pseudouridine38-40 synthase
MTRLKITVSYDGAAYAGWQVQPNGVTVQEKLETALNRLTGEKVKVHGSGRTDTGVHARAQVAHVDLERAMPLKTITRALNGMLPPDIRVLKVETASSTFHARRSVRIKEYRYFIWTGKVMPPFVRRYRTHVAAALGVAAMQAAAALLVGRHDFSAFTANPNRRVESTVRTLQGLRVTKRGSEVVIAARADGFLYKMVRSLAGFLIRVGQGDLTPADATRILASKERTARVPTAPASGLFLWNVTY